MLSLREANNGPYKDALQIGSLWYKIIGNDWSALLDSSSFNGTRSSHDPTDELKVILLLVRHNNQPKCIRKSESGRDMNSALTLEGLLPFIVWRIFWAVSLLHTLEGFFHSLNHGNRVLAFGNCGKFSCQAQFHYIFWQYKVHPKIILIKNCGNSKWKGK